MSDTDLAIIMILGIGICILALLLVAFYVIFSVSVYRMCKALHIKEKSLWEAWVPYWQYTCVAEVLQAFPDRIQDLTTIIMGVAIVRLVGLLPIPFIGVLTYICSILIYVFNLYAIYKLSNVIDGKTNVLLVVLAAFGFSTFIYFYYSCKLVDNIDTISLKRCTVDEENQEYNHYSPVGSKVHNDSNAERKTEESEFTSDEIILDKHVVSNGDDITPEEEIINLNKQVEPDDGSEEPEQTINLEK
jgi:hypothetical protein